MIDYRIYCLDGGGGIGFPEWFEADGDEDAVGRAQKSRPGAQRCEVWERSRLVAIINQQSAGLKVGKAQNC